MPQTVFKHFTDLTHCFSQPHEVGVIIVSSLQMRKLRQKEVPQLTKGSAVSQATYQSCQMEEGGFEPGQGGSRAHSLTAVQFRLLSLG